MPEGSGLASIRHHGRALPGPPILLRLTTVSRKRHTNDMSSDSVTKPGLLRIAQTDQALAWLVRHGPLVTDPPLPFWVLRQLVRTERIARLRRGLYLAPQANGRLPSLPAAAALVEPSGHLSFYGALTLHGLTDQDTARWGMVTARRRRPIRYGRVRLEFVTWPARLRTAKAATRRIDGVHVRIATPVQAFCDTLEAPRLGPSLPEMLHVLRTGLSTRRLSLASLRACAREVNSTVLARRLGLLLELATGDADPELLAMAQRSHAWGRAEERPGTVSESRWRLLLPRTRGDLIRAARE